MASNLFNPIYVGKCHVQNRIAMAPLTRFRSPNHVPNALNVEYYGQRASTAGTLLITEGTFITAAAGGFQDAPGIYNQDQISGWKKVFTAVHDKKSFVFMQLWALGRSADKAYLEKSGHEFVGASAIPWVSNTVEFVRETSRIMAHNKQVEAAKDPKQKLLALPRPPKQPAPRELTDAEIQQYIQDYAQAARNAIEAGADGVEIHGANGYLPDQFLCEFTNHRTDKWGGSIENRARFMLAIVDAVVEAVGAHRTALRLSPWGWYLGKDGKSPVAQWGYLITELEKRARARGSSKGSRGEYLAYLHLIDPRGAVGAHPLNKFNTQASNAVFSSLWHGVLIRAGGYTLDSAIEETNEDGRLLVAMGRYFLSTPDIVKRWKEAVDSNASEKDGEVQLNPYDRATFYTEGERGYVDYPFAKNAKL